jgi:hypothetical protein
LGLFCAKGRGNAGRLRRNSVFNPQSEIRNPQLSRPPAGAAPNWLCSSEAAGAYHSSQLLIHTALAPHFARPEIGFVWRRSPVRSNVITAPCKGRGGETPQGVPWHGRLAHESVRKHNLSRLGSQYRGRPGRDVEIGFVWRNWSERAGGGRAVPQSAISSPRTPIRGRSPQSAMGELALFFRGRRRVPFVATPYPHSTCPPFRPARNWVCLAQKGRAGTLE